MKWLKKKINLHNNNLDYSNYEDVWILSEWICGVILSIILPLICGVCIGIKRNSWIPLIFFIILSVVSVIWFCLQINLFSPIEKNIKNEIEDEFDNIDNNLDFVWGLTSLDNFSGNETASLYSMNDIEIIYDKTTKKYCLNIETIYQFKEEKLGEIKYLKRLLKAFTKFMEENNYDINKPYILSHKQPKIDMIADSIPELYTNFRIFVEGYSTLYEETE